jgi:hypothetical protein
MSKTIFNNNFIKNTNSYKNLKKKTKKSQLDYYIDNGAPKEILDFIKLSNKAFGSECEKIIIEIFKLEKSNESSYDAKYKDYKVEIKSSRIWNNLKDLFKWQHIMENHNYDFIIFCGIDINEFKFWIISKEKLLSLKETKCIKKQGGAEGQGLWCEYSKIKNILTEINSINDISEYIKN